MARFGGVHKARRRAGGGEGGRELAADMAALAHAGDDHAAFSRLQFVDRPQELHPKLSVERTGEEREPPCFGLQGIAG